MIFGPPPFMGSSPATETFLGSAVTSTSATTQTFASMPLGPVAAGRTIAVFVNGNSGTLRTVSGITVDGVALSPVVGRSNSLSRLELWIGVVNTANTVGSIAVTWSGAQSRAVISVYSVANLQSPTAIATNSSGTSGAAIAAASLAGGVVLAAAGTNNGGTFTWAGDVTEDMDQSTASLVSLSTAGGLTTGTSASATPTASSSSQFNSIIATFR